MKRLTLKELSLALKLSISTVSKALNDSYEISEETKKKVKRYAEEHNYQPNTLAKYLKLGRTNNIGAVLPSIRSPFDTQIIDGLHQAALANNFNLILMQSREREDLEEQAILSLMQQGMDGIIIAPVHEKSNIELITRIHENTCPVILLDRINYNLDTYKIGVNNAKSVYDATQELLKIGRRKIAVLCGKNLGVTKERLQGYIEALQQAGISHAPEHIVYVEYKSSIDEMDEELHQKLSDIFRSDNPPNAILGTTETLTTRALATLVNLGIKVPEDVAVIGFSNTDLANSLNPALSTIKQPAKAMAALALEKTVSLIHSKKRRNQIDFKEILLDSSIQLRKSTEITALIR